MIPTIKPDWPAPFHIHALMTTRDGGVSQAPYHSLNLGDHVGDNTEHVALNRQRLCQELQLPSEPVWLNQTHSTDVTIIENNQYCDRQSDAAYTSEKNRICTVLTADCLPLLVTNRKGSEVAAIHAGWRGLANGVIEVTLSEFQSPPEEIMVWLGAAIGSEAFEVGDEVVTIFASENREAEQAFTPSKSDRRKWFADIYHLARLRLEKMGINAIYGGGLSTYSDDKRFYSYRRDGITGRMATMIWIADQ